MLSRWVEEFIFQNKFMLENILLITTIILLAITLIVLVVGVVSMVKGGEFYKKHGNKLMRMRVGFQAASIICMMTLLYVSST